MWIRHSQAKCTEMSRDVVQAWFLVVLGVMMAVMAVIILLIAR
jgi:hypothetical protein